jgi:hypothetical protein
VKRAKPKAKHILPSTSTGKNFDDQNRPLRRAAQRPFARLNQDFFMSMDKYLRTARHSASAVAKRWDMPVKDVREISSRWKKRCEELFKDKPDSKFWQTAVEFNRKMILSKRIAK